MAKRTQLTKSQRFEIFKRDMFTCQYCGKSAPEVILEVDHVIPIAEGGTNDAFNLITSCRDCNRGKGKKLLSDQSTIEKQKQQLQRQNERREQVEMLIEWKKSVAETTERMIDEIEEQMHANGMFKEEQYLTACGRNEVKDLLKRFGFDLVYDAVEIAAHSYVHKQGKSAEYAFMKIGGICWNKIHQERKNE